MAPSPLQNKRKNVENIKSKEMFMEYSFVMVRKIFYLLRDDETEF